MTELYGFSEGDLDVDVYHIHPNIKIGVPIQWGVKVTHIPTGLSVKSEDVKVISVSVKECLILLRKAVDNSGKL